MEEPETAANLGQDVASPPVRRKWLRGYRAADVDAHFVMLRGELWQARMRAAALEKEKRELQLQLDESRGFVAELGSTVAEAAARCVQMETDARREAQEIRDSALIDAARIRDEAAAEEELLRRQIDGLVGLRGTLAATIRTVVRDFERVMADAELRELGEGTTRPEPWAPGEASAVLPVAEEPVVGRGGVFGRRVEVEVGPFNDFSSLSAFERELAGLPNVEDVYVRRFEAERATIDVILEEPGPLLDEMTRRLPYLLTVDRADNDRIELSVAAGVA